MNKILNFLIWMLFVLFSFVGKAQQLSLEECLRLVKENHFDFKIQTLKIEQKKETKRSFGSQFLPEIGLSASHSYNFGSSIDPSTNNRLPSNIQSDNLSIDARINLFDFSKWNQTKIQTIDVEIEKMEFEVIENQLELLVLEKYIKAFSLQEWKKSLVFQIENSKQQLNRVEKEVEEGRRSKSDAYDIQVIYLQDENNLKKALQEEQLVKLELLQLLNTSQFNVENCELIQPEVFLNSSEDFSVEEHPSVQKIRLQNNKSKEEYKQLISSFLPSLGFAYSYGTFFAQRINNFSDTSFQFGNQLKDNKSQYVGLSLYVPIFNKGNSSQKRRLKKLEEQTIAEEEAKEEKRLNDLIETETKKLQLLQEQQKSLYELTQVSKKSFETTESKYLFDKVDASVYKSAKNQLLQSEYDVLVNQLDQIFVAYQLQLNFKK